jgi:ankyrin
MSDHQQYNYMTSDENKPFDDSMNTTNMSMDPTKEEKSIEKIIASAEKSMIAEREYSPNPLDITVTDNAAITRKPIHVG